MKNNLQLIDSTTISKVVEETNKVISDIALLSRYQTVMEKPFKVVDSEKMNYIVEKSNEINEKIYNFSKSSTQVVRKLMSLTMLNTADSTYLVLKQILAQIERKQTSLTDNLFRLKDKQLKLKKYEIKIRQYMDKLEKETDPYEKELIQVEIAALNNKISKIKIAISNAFSYIEATIKEIGALLESYEEIKKNKGISDNWSEQDVEQHQVQDMIKGAFRNCIRDFLVHGRIGMGTAEWFEQLGISPLEAIKEVTDFINAANIKLNKDNTTAVDYDMFYEFLNQMADKYKDCYKKALKRIGIDNLISNNFTLKCAALENNTQLEE